MFDSPRRDNPHFDFAKDYQLEKARNTFALKVLFPRYSLDDEQRVMEQIPPHRNIVGYDGLITLENKTGLLYEFIDGPKLVALIDELCSSGLPAEELFNAWKYLEQGRIKAII